MKTPDMSDSSKRTEKPWGFEHLIELNNDYMVKYLFMKAGEQCSLQYHNHKRETIFVLKGQMTIRLGGTTKIYNSGETITIPPGLIHQMTALSDCTYLECSTPHVDDTIRVEDKYGRNTTITDPV